VAVSPLDSVTRWDRIALEMVCLMLAASRGFDRCRASLGSARETLDAAARGAVRLTGRCLAAPAVGLAGDASPQMWVLRRNRGSSSGTGASVANSHTDGGRFLDRTSQEGAARSGGHFDGGVEIDLPRTAARGNGPLARTGHGHAVLLQAADVERDCLLDPA
jgi:hypothetical protein